MFLCLIVFPVFSQEKITLLFAGDLMQHQGQIEAAGRTTPKAFSYDYSDCFLQVKQEISKADIAIGNLEVTLGGKPYTGYPAFSAPDEYLYAILNAGFDVLITANNHCLDRGKKGLERTVQLLDSLKIPHAGTYLNKAEREAKYPLLIQKNGFNIVILNYTYGTNGIPVQKPNIVNIINKEQIAIDIQKARSMRPDVIIACMHWGEEYKFLPNKEQKDLADYLIAQGVDHIIGSHPHVLQPMELRKNANFPTKNAVIYSLGNFISNMSARYTDGGALFKLELRKQNGIVQVDNCSYSLVWTARPQLTGKKNYMLIPAASPKESLPSSALNRLIIFMNDSRKLFAEYNEGIKEYLFH